MADVPHRGDARVDERDTMFARAERSPGTAEYADYYARRPELKAIDDRIRALPGLLEPGGRYYTGAEAARAREHFEAISRWAPDVERVERIAESLREGSALDGALRAAALELGAAAVGAAEVEERFVYSHKGRFDDEYGRPIEADLPWALVVLVEMDHERMAAAPKMPTIIESAHQYRRAAEIVRTLAAALEASGHRARAHYDAHYEVILPPLAVAAGLGEVGRNNILVADRFGARVRIGAVTTDAPLVPDAPRSLGVRRFCERCKKCSDNCPTGALSGEAAELTGGVPRWSTRVERCYAYWRRVGTDCGVCMAVCPFSHRDDPFHGLVRWLVREIPALVPLALRGDDLLYGHRWTPKP